MGLWRSFNCKWTYTWAVSVLAAQVVASPVAAKAATYSVSPWPKLLGKLKTSLPLYASGDGDSRPLEPLEPLEPLAFVPP